MSMVAILLSKRDSCIAVAIAAGLLAGKILESPCEKAIFLIGAASIPRIISESRTTATGRFITKRAV